MRIQEYFIHLVNGDHIKIGEHYDGVISSIIDAGCFVRLENTVEGFVPFRSLRDHYFFDERTYRAIGAHGGKILSIGMPVTIVVEKVDTEENKIDFSFEYGFEEERDPMEKHLSKGRVKEPHKVKKGGRSGRGGAGSHFCRASDRCRRAFCRP